MRVTKGKSLAIAAIASFSLFTAACGSSVNSRKSGSADAPITSDVAAYLVGPGCADYVKAAPKGKGSVSGMAPDPVATAASNNPLLKTLVAAISGKLNKDVNLVGTLNSGQFTVFAPVDSAFAKLPAATVKTLGTAAGADALSSILTYHVIPGQMILPKDIVGTYKTLNGADLKISGSGDNIDVGGQATVICGGVKTANATVYLIDRVLSPPAK
ncbi:MAG: fasciclin domain-containing protein [Kineosporiaceae bacterium]|nr:fasciclin domain-containing protein [Aeromicrobium sp.]